MFEGQGSVFVNFHCAHSISGIEKPLSTCFLEKKFSGREFVRKYTPFKEKIFYLPFFFQTSKMTPKQYRHAEIDLRTLLTRQNNHRFVFFA